MRVRIVIRLSKAVPSPAYPIFGLCQQRRETRWRGGAGSVLAHAFAAAAIFGLTPQPEAGNLLSWRGEPLMLRVLEPLYIPRDLTAGNDKSAGAPAKRRSAADSRAGEIRRPTTVTALSALVELPAPPLLSRDGSVLLQPRLTAQAAPRPLPPVAFWSRQRPPAVRPKLVIPGRAESAAQLPDVSTPPTLDIPNREQRLADINVAAAAILSQPALAAPPSATTPVRIFRPPASQPVARAGTLDALEGEPAQVLSASAPVFPLDRIVAVPAGIAAPPRYERGGSGHDGRDTRDGLGAGAGDSGSGENERRGNGKNGYTGNGPAEIRENSSLGGRAPEAGRPSNGRPSTVVLPDRSVQTVYPANGNFDVVVVQSTSENALPEGVGILAGKPIYTVYLHVGSGKDWILQYCATPSTAPAQPNGQVVNLADSMGIQPPYPISTTMPVLGRRAKYLLVRGVLGANGRFRNLKLASEAAGITQLDLFRYLETWSFRPVTQAARPIDVEALLAIPPS